jgi:hypothetical protein
MPKLGGDNASQRGIKNIMARQNTTALVNRPSSSSMSGAGFFNKRASPAFWKSRAKQPVSVRHNHSAK